MWKSHGLCEISTSRWKPICGFHRDDISTAVSHGHAVSAAAARGRRPCHAEVKRRVCRSMRPNSRCMKRTIQSPCSVSAIPTTSRRTAVLMKTRSPRHVISPLWRTRRTSCVASYHGSSRRVGYGREDTTCTRLGGCWPSASCGRSVLNSRRMRSNRVCCCRGVRAGGGVVSCGNVR